MASFNKIIIVGNLGRDAALRYTPQGTAVSEFSVATTEKRGDNETTTWFRVTLWGKQAEAVNQYLVKGKQVYVEGKVSLSDWTDKEGNKRQTLEVKADNIQLLGGRVESSDAEPTPQQAAFAAQAPSGPRKVASKKPQDEFRGGGGVEDDSGIPF